MKARQMVMTVLGTLALSTQLLATTPSNNLAPAPANAAAHVARSSYIVQAQSLAAAIAAVRQVNGKLTHELAVINAVAANLTAAQAAALRTDKRLTLTPKYACDESGRSDKLATLRIESAGNGVRICVVDNGAGILAQNMGRLFTHGFTTRHSGYGFGLHSGALAAQDRGGSLRAMSDGPGCGAAFILELPCSPSEAANA